MDRFFVTPAMDLPMEDIPGGAQFAATLEDCGRLCDQHNAILKGATDQPAYGFGQCNAFVYDASRRQCTLKNKAMGNFDPVQGKPTACSHTVAGYRWNALTNEINDAFPNRTSGMQYNPLPARVAWSHDNDADVSPGFDVRPGAIFSPYNAAPVQVTLPFRVASMQVCANAVSQVPGANAFTFRPDYTSQSAVQPIVGGTCTVGTVREPVYQTLTTHDNGAISGFSISELAPTVSRFLFG